MAVKSVKWKNLLLVSVGVLIILIAILWYVRGTTQPADPVVIRMDGMNVTLSHIQEAYAALPPAVKLRVSLSQFATSIYPRKILLVRAAEDAGYALPLENASQVLQEIDAQFKQQNSSLDTYLAQQGLTREVFRKALAEDMLVQAYIQDLLGQINITVNETETRSLYDQANLSKQNLSYENVSQQLAQLIKQQKEQAYLNQYIAFLAMKYNLTVLTETLQSLGVADQASQTAQVIQQNS